MDEFNERLHHEEQVDPEGEVKDENSFSTLGFPIGDLPRGATPMKKSHSQHCQIFMGYLQRILMNFCLSLIYYVEVMIMFLMLRN
jgi:hypothetical protein